MREKFRYDPEPLIGGRRAKSCVPSTVLHRRCSLLLRHVGPSDGRRAPAAAAKTSARGPVQTRTCVLRWPGRKGPFGPDPARAASHLRLTWHPSQCPSGREGLVLQSRLRAAATPFCR